MKLPAIQFYPADWRKDPGVQSLDYFDRGVWFEMLCLMHESTERGKLTLNGGPMPDEALARILGLDNQTLTKTLTTLLRYGVASRDESGALVNRRMVKDEKLRQVRTEAGKKGGNPALLNQNPTNGGGARLSTQVNQNSTPSSSSSSSTTDSTTSSNKEKTEEARTAKPRSPRTLNNSCDDDYLAELQTREPYLNLNVRNVYGKMVTWCENKGKQPTRSRLINWLNREDQPMNGNGNGSYQTSTGSGTGSDFEFQPKSITR